MLRLKTSQFWFSSGLTIITGDSDILEAVTNTMFCISVGEIPSFNGFPFEYLKE